ncbi:thioredoxin-like protein, partial [Protomyces lactucae-debilis]
MVAELTSLSQFNDLKKKPLLVVDFHAEWCGPCKQISPIFNALATKHASSRVVFAKCDVDRVRDVAQICGITAMPTFQFYCNGKKVDEIKGASGPALTAKIAQY